MLITRLLHVVQLVCALAFYPGDVAFMKSEIEDFLESYHSAYPDETVIPKEHYTLHYGSQTEKFGPLIKCSTMRYDGRHQFLKKKGNRTRNCKNLCKTLAKHHQLDQARYYEKPNYLGEATLYCRCHQRCCLPNTVST